MVGRQEEAIGGDAFIDITEFGGTSSLLASIFSGIGVIALAEVSVSLRRSLGVLSSGKVVEEVRSNGTLLEEVVGS